MKAYRRGIIVPEFHFPSGLLEPGLDRESHDSGCGLKVKPISVVLLCPSFTFLGLLWRMQ